MRNAIRWAALAAVCLALCSCGLFTNEQYQAALAVINQMELQNTITSAQAQALREALDMSTGEPWWQQASRVVLEVALAIAGVRLWRGPSATPGERSARRTARQS